MPNKQLLAYRRYAGIGDWIMALSVLKMVNQQRPDIDITINTKAINLHRGDVKPMDLPSLTTDFIKDCDVDIKDYIYEMYPTGSTDKYDILSGYMKYRKRAGINFVKSMVQQFNRHTGLNIQYDPNIKARFTGTDNPTPEIAKLKPYVLIQSCSKRRHRTQQWKDYGADNMQVIANHLKSEVNVVQVGRKGTIALNGMAAMYFSSSLPTFHKLMKNCVAFIGLDGMLGVYAANHDIPHYIIYSGKFNFNWTDFPQRLQVNGNNLKPKQISEIIIKKLRGIIISKMLMGSR